MKLISTIILCTVFSITTFAQSTQSATLIFDGISSNTKNYKVLLDAKSFYSNKNYNTNDNSQNIVTIDGLKTASHTIKVYRLGNNDTKYNNTSKKALVYSKTFNLRKGYDMDITINANGGVQMDETPTSDEVQSNDKTAMANGEFSQLLQSVKNKWSQALKGETVNEALSNSNNYFTVNQIKQLLTLITSENDRLDLAKLSYRSATDSANFTLLYDLFKSQESKDELNEFLQTKGWNVSGGQNVTKAPMSTSKFNLLLQDVRSKWSQALKGETENDAFNNPDNYFTTNQIRQLLTLITSETDRLDLAKLSYRSLTDSANFTQLYDLFKAQASKDELNTFLYTKGWNVPAGQNLVKVPMADAKFNVLLQNVRSKWSQALKGETESEAFNNPNNYFSTNQIKQLLTLITSESDRVDLAKLSYRSVTDSANLIQLLDLFKLEESRSELISFLNAKGIKIQGNQAPLKTPMSDENFSQLVFNVRSNMIQLLKVGYEKEVFNNPDNFFSTNQIRQLLLLINSEPNRLELAKLSYRTATDPANFSQLYNLFNLQGSRDELANYIKNK